MADSIRIAGVIRQSIVDGPGLRMVVFAQGCPLHCPGCHNPQAQDPAGGQDCTIEKILHLFDQNPLLLGITLSGGEPFAQARHFVPLAKAIHERGRTVWCYSGYTWEELLTMAQQQPEILALLQQSDVLVDGRFDETQKSLNLRFRGSKNQRVLDVVRSLQAGRPVAYRFDGEE